MYPGFRFELNLSKWKFIAYIVSYINLRFINLKIQYFVSIRRNIRKITLDI